MTFFDDDAPKTNGFSAGMSMNNTQAFIGRGVFRDQPAPGRLQIESPSGVGITTAEGERRLESRIEYLVLPEGCQCSWVAPKESLKRPGLVLVIDLMVGRKNFSNGRVAVTKVEATLNQWYINEAGNETKDEASEVLVCEGNNAMKTRATVKLANAACGEFTFN
jgi:pyrrolidone-carboxylate peptidase